VDGFFSNPGLAAYRVANVFDRFADFSPRFAEAFLDFAACMICAAFSLEFLVVDGSANTFFYIAFYLIQFSINFVSIR
jgi:hypothetical protein